MTIPDRLGPEPGEGHSREDHSFSAFVAAICLLGAVVVLGVAAACALVRWYIAP